MKRKLAVLSLVLVIAMMAAPMAFAGGLEVTGITPKDGKTGLQVTNLAVKVKFNSEVSSPDNDKTNETKLQILDAEGKPVDVSYTVAHSDKHTDELWYIVDGTIDPNSEYTVKLAPGVVANNGNTLANEYTSTFKTRNTKTDSTISLLLMIAMMALMFISTSKATKAAAADSDPRAVEKKREEALNPYKIAKEKNISLDEAKAYVAKEKEKYRKEQEKIAAEIAKKEAARQAEIEALEKQIEAELANQRDEYVFRVKERASITKSGREVPKAVIKLKKKRAEQKLAKERAAEAARQANAKGRKAKK